MKSKLWRVCVCWLLMMVAGWAAVACSGDAETVSGPPEPEAGGGATVEGFDEQDRALGRDGSAEARRGATEEELGEQDKAVLREIAMTDLRLRENADAFSYGVSRHGGSLSVSLTSDPLTFNPALVNDVATAGVMHHIFEGLVSESWLTGEPEPALAESWEVSDDGRTWTFRLRENVRWHDGEPFTSDDVVFTFNRVIYNDDIPTSVRAYFEFALPDDEFALPDDDGSAPLSRKVRMTVRALDDHTVEFDLPVPFAPFLRSLRVLIYPEHILASHVEDGTFAEAWGVDAAPGDIVGTGPFYLSSYEPGDRLVLMRNPYYWLMDQNGDPLPYLDEVMFRISSSYSESLEAFMNGDTDMEYVRGADFSWLEMLQQEGLFTIHRLGPGFGTHYLIFNMNPGYDPATERNYLSPAKLRWFTDLRFRRAVALSIDKEAIIRDVQHGLGYLQWAYISPAAGEFHNPDVDKYRYDPTAASAILDTLRWIDDNEDGIRTDSDGNDLRFTIAIGSGNLEYEAMAEIIAAGLRDIGIRVDIELLESLDLVDRLTSTHDWEAVIIGFGSTPEPHSGMPFWHSAGAYHIWNPNQSQPATDWESEVDDLYITASQELNHQKRVQHYHRAQQIIAENLPVISLTQPELLAVTSNTLANLIPTPYALYDIRYLYREPLEESALLNLSPGNDRDPNSAEGWS